MTDAAREFQDAMADAGVACPDLPIADGHIHRFHVDGDKKGHRNGWYAFYMDGVPAGAFGSWRNGEIHTWCGKRAGTLTDFERVELRRRMDATKAERERQRAEESAKAQAEAQKQWDVDLRPNLTQVLHLIMYHIRPANMSVTQAFFAKQRVKDSMQ
jgi:putative DNA primase/helicase